MDIKNALKSQYRASLAMLKQAVKRCPDELWLKGEHPRNFWRVAYHAIYYTHVYLGKDQASFVPWKDHKPKVPILWGKPKVDEPYTQKQVISYVDDVAQNLDQFIDDLDLDQADCGFSYYPGMNKLDHQLVNLRHLQGHVGQLSELLMAQGIQTDWIGSK